MKGPTRGPKQTGRGPAKQAGTGEIQKGDPIAAATEGQGVGHREFRDGASRL